MLTGIIMIIVEGMFEQSHTSKASMIGKNLQLKRIRASKAPTDKGSKSI